MSESPILKPVEAISAKTAQKMPYFSLRGMLQKTLYDAAIHFLERTDSDFSAVTQSTSNLPNNFGAFSVDWVPIKLHRQVYPVSYCSAIARKLGGIAQHPLQQILEGLKQTLLQIPLDLSQLSNLDKTGMPRIAEFTVQVQENGKISLILAEPALLDWVQSFLQAPWGLSGRFCEPLKPEDGIGVSPLSRRLALSPIALLQYHHADCCTYLWRVQETMPSVVSKSPARPGTTSSTEGLCHRAMIEEQPPLSRAQRQVLWSLINLADALEEPSVSTQLRIQAGSTLAEALYQWSAQAQAERSPNVLSLWLVQAAQRLLKHLLEDQLGCNAPSSL